MSYSLGMLLVSGDYTHQEMYAPAFARDPRCRLVAVTDEADVDAERRAWNEALAHRHGIPHIADLSESLQLPQTQAVSICAPPDRRARIAIQCARAGKHLYLDKPLAPRLEQAHAIVTAVQQAGVHSHMFSFITQPWARRAERLLAGGYVGQIRAIHAETLFAKGSAGTAVLGTSRQEEYPPGRQQLVTAKRELDNIGIYPISLISWLTKKRYRTVYGTTANYFFREHQEQDVEDFGVLSCTLEGGIPITIAAGRTGWCSHPAGGLNRVTVVGSKQTLVLDANQPRLEVYAAEPPWTPPAGHPKDPMAFWSTSQKEAGFTPKRTWLPLFADVTSDARYFLDCLEADRPSEMSVVEAARATEVLLAGYRSAATGKVVELDLPG